MLLFVLVHLLFHFPLCFPLSPWCSCSGCLGVKHWRYLFSISWNMASVWKLKVLHGCRAEDILRLQLFRISLRMRVCSTSWWCHNNCLSSHCVTMCLRLWQINFGSFWFEGLPGDPPPPPPNPPPPSLVLPPSLFLPKACKHICIQ